MKKKICMALLLAGGFCGILSAHHNPDKKKGSGNPGNDTVQTKDAHAKTGLNKISNPPAPKSKIAVPVKKSDTYEMKAPSIFTFTVLSTYFNMPLQKK